MLDDKQNLINNQIEQPSRLKKVASGSGSAFLVFLKILPYFLFSLLIFAIIATIILALAIIPHYAAFSSVYANGNQGKNHLQVAQSAIGQRNFVLAGTEFEKAEQNFISANQSIEVLDQAGLFQNKYLKNQLEIAGDIIKIGEQMSGSLKNISDIGQEINQILNQSNVSFLQLDENNKTRILQIVLDSTTQLESAQNEFEQINNQLENINQKQPWFIFDPVIDPLQEQIPKLAQTYDNVMVLIKLFPALTGYPQEQKYLVLLQNNREMRPSGGFIGAYGILTVQNAEIKNLFIDNSYNLDFPVKEILHIEPPEPIKEYMNQEDWFFRDSNWWPDFPKSAQNAIWFFDKESAQKVPIDGVIALTPTLIEQILGYLGEITVSNITFNQENFWKQLQYQVEFGYYRQGISEEDRKDVIGELAKKVIAQIQALPMNQWPDLLEIINQQLQQKHLVFYFKEVPYQQIVMENSWAGEVQKFEGDYIQLVDANLAALKTDSVMERTLNYKLEQNDDEILGTVSVNYQNTGNFSAFTTRYRSYTRLYVPAGSELISVSAGEKKYAPEEIDGYNEFDKTAFGIFFEVEPLNSKIIEWKYKLPDNIIDQEKYQLFVQKQIGLPEINLQLDLNFDKEISAGNQKKIKYFEELITDQIYNVWFE